MSTWSHEFKNCTFVVDFDHSYAETRFPDGSKVPAVPHDTDEYRENARKYGYGSDTAALSREHEFLHTWLAEEQGKPYSPTLWAVAHEFAEGTAALHEQYAEEDIVLKFQRYINTGESDDLPHSVLILVTRMFPLLAMRAAAGSH